MNTMRYSVKIKYDEMSVFSELDIDFKTLTEKIYETYEEAEKAKDAANELILCISNVDSAFSKNNIIDVYIEDYV